MELRMALAGKETWEIFKSFETMAGVEPNGQNNPFTCPWTWKTLSYSRGYEWHSWWQYVQRQRLTRNKFKQGIKGIFQSKKQRF